MSTTHNLTGSNQLHGETFPSTNAVQGTPVLCPAQSNGGSKRMGQNLSCGHPLQGASQSGTQPRDRVPISKVTPDSLWRGLPGELQAFITSGHDQLLIAPEVAALLRVSERWVRDHTTRRSPKLRGVNLGSLVRYRLSDVMAFLQARDAEACSDRKKSSQKRRAA